MLGSVAAQAVVVECRQAMTVSSQSEDSRTGVPVVIEREEIVVRFSGDSGDGMQLAGMQMTDTSALLGNDISTFPDFPAEIRPPAGTLDGVSGFQLNFGSRKVRTPGDRVDALIAMNPAALKGNIGDLEPGGVVIVNTDAFVRGNLAKAGYVENPLESGALSCLPLEPDELSRSTRADGCVPVRGAADV